MKFIYIPPHIYTYNDYSCEVTTRIIISICIIAANRKICYNTNGRGYRARELSMPGSKNSELHPTVLSSLPSLLHPQRSPQEFQFQVRVASRIFEQSCHYVSLVACSPPKHKNNRMTNLKYQYKAHRMHMTVAYRPALPIVFLLLSIYEMGLVYLCLLYQGQI